MNDLQDPTQNTEGTENPRSRRWRRGRGPDDPDERRFPLISALLIGAIVVIGVVCLILMLLPGHDQDRAAAPSTGPAPITTATPSSPEDTDTSGPCGQPADRFGVPGTDHWGQRVEQPVNPNGQACATTLSTAPNAPSAPGTPGAPALLVWERVYGVALPFSAGAGPTTISGTGVPSGFAHTPQGAITAAMQITLRSVMAPAPATRTAVSDAGYLFPPGQRAGALARIGSAEATIPDEVKYAYGIPAAVRVSTYRPDFAHVQWAGGPSTDSTYVLLEADLSWTGTDWKVVFPQNGNGTSTDGTTVTALPAAEGWTQWAA
ncbi:MAG: hypothetical protein INR66_00095 [Gordonia polyisoprenivorans]|nr:hypothetical protein [Gordonia polyisoprenivorans]